MNAGLFLFTKRRAGTVFYVPVPAFESFRSTTIAICSTLCNGVLFARGKAGDRLLRFGSTLRKLPIDEHSSLLYPLQR